jgi:hypothetical protein
MWAVGCIASAAFPPGKEHKVHNEYKLFRPRAGQESNLKSSVKMLIGLRLYRLLHVGSLDTEKVTEKDESE